MTKIITTDFKPIEERVLAEYGKSNKPVREHQGIMVFGEKAIRAYQPDHMKRGFTPK